MERDAEWPPKGWTAGTIEHGTHEHTYYVLDRHGPERPSVLLLHEFPGIEKSLVELAERIAQSFRVVVPSIVGRDGSPSTAGSLIKLCMRREVHLLRTGRPSPAIPWLRRLLDDHVSRGRPCGVIGMCMTGNFALALAVQPPVRAAVVAQPAVPVSHLGPLPLPHASARASDLGLGRDLQDALVRKVADDRDALCMRAYRFRDDAMSDAAKVQAVQDLLGDEIVKVVTLSEPDPSGHSTLTRQRNEAAVEEVCDFLVERLGTGV